jgi:hypothetical protein
MAFVLIQHLDPKHESMMVDLLARRTAMKVLEAADGMPIARNCLYVTPPNAYLSIDHGVLRLSHPSARPGARMPIDFFLSSLAEEYGERSVGIILSGTGGDGSVGLKAISEKGGLVIAQDPEDAAYDGMPRSAITTGAVNLVLPAAKIHAPSSGTHSIPTSPRPVRPRWQMKTRPKRSAHSLRFCDRERLTTLAITERRRYFAGSDGGWRPRESKISTTTLGCWRRTTASGSFS